MWKKRFIGFRKGDYLDINKIINKVRNRTPKAMDISKKYSVLIPLIERDGDWEVIFELRAKNMKSQPGEISFPGGRLEKNESYEEAAIRETIEELRIKEENINVVGELDYLVSYANITIHCFLALISGVNVDKIQPNKEEVDHLFTVPIKYFLDNDPKIYYLDLTTMDNDEFPYNLIPNGKDYNWRRGKHSVYFYEYKDYIIWGYTAKMIRHLVEIIKDL